MFFEALILLSCQLLGSWLVDATAIPLPGPVMGMLLLFAYLVARRGLPEPMEQICSPLLRHMALLFIPAGSGVLLYIHRVTDEWLAISTVVLVGTALTLVITAWIIECSIRFTERRDGPNSGPRHDAAHPSEER